MSARDPLGSPRLDGLALPLVPGFVPAAIGDTVRLAQPGGAWFYCHIEDRMPDGSLLCRAIDAQSWPLLMVEGIVPGGTYAVPPDRVLSVVRPAA